MDTPKTGYVTTSYKQGNKSEILSQNSTKTIICFVEINAALHSTMGLYNRSLHYKSKVKFSKDNLINKKKIRQLID